MVSSTSRLWLTARPASSSAWVSRARRWLSSKRRAFWMAAPAWSANASSSIGWRSVKKPGVVEKAEMTPMISPATRRGTLSMERMPSFSSTSRCAERASARRSSERTGCPEAAARPMMPSPMGTLSRRHSGVRNPWAAA